MPTRNEEPKIISMQVERRWKVNQLYNENALVISVAPIQQAHLVAIDEPNVDVRIRNEGGECTEVRKSGSGLIRTTERHNISLSYFRTLMRTGHYAPIDKVRHKIELMGIIMTVDVIDDGTGKEILIAQRQFHSGPLAESFQFPTDLFGNSSIEDVTNDVAFTSRHMALARI